jgi:SNF2 family DNA or RNA helicase
VKELTPTQINSALAEFIPENLIQNLWLHQKAALLLMQYHPRFIWHIGLGGGKTRLMLTMLRHRKLKGEKPRAVVFTPSINAIDTWIEEVKKFAPELNICPLLDSSDKNKASIFFGDDINLFVVCYQTAVAMLTHKIKKTEESKGKWLLIPESVKVYFGSCDTLIMDEVHKVKGWNSITFEMCKSISNTANWVYGLTATPFGKSMEDLWAEFYVIDFGKTLGPNISFYRNVFFTRKSKFFGGVEFIFKKKLTHHLQRIIKNKSIHYSVKEFADMPDKQYIQHRIQLPETFKSYVERARDELEEAVRNKDFEVAGNAFMQLRQLSSGFITFKDDEDRVKIKFDSNPKLDVLCELIEAMPPECKMVVFHDYVFTNELISNRLKELKIGHARIWGGQRDQIGQLKKFREDCNCKILVINSRSGSSALNLQFASYMCFLECPSIIDREQAEARCWRPGQKQKVIIYDLFVRGTVDEEYYNSVKEGGNFLRDFLRGKKEA